MTKKIPVRRGTTKKRRALARSDERQERLYYVYVIRLRDEVIRNRQFAKRNEQYLEGKPCVYVGSSVRTPKERLQQHLDGQRANRVAHEFGWCLTAKHYAKYNPMKTRQEAEKREVEIASTLRRKGFAVWQG
jgi:Uri superfamily endonuclease